MSGDDAKKMVIGGEKSATSHGKAPSRRRMDPLHAFDRTRVTRRRRK
jgi:hypothetical protein